MYFFDNNNRILVSEPSMISVYIIESTREKNKDLILSLHYTVDALNPTRIKQPDVVTKRENIEEPVMRTSSGRIIRPCNSEAINEINSEELTEALIASVDYEDELDILVVTIQKAVYLYRNSDGKFLRKIPLDAYWMNEGKNTVILDKTRIVLMSSSYFSSNCSVQILQLSFNEPHDIEITGGTSNSTSDITDLLHEYAYDSDYTE